MIKYVGVLATIALFIGASLDAHAQCKSFTKKKCMKNLGEFTSNGQYNGAVMFEGEEASLMQTFYSDKKYRLLVCTHPAITEGMFFEVMDYRNNLIYTSEGKDSEVFDFNVESTQQLKIRIVIPDGKSGSQIKKNGCVSVVVGFQEK